MSSLFVLLLLGPQDLLERDRMLQRALSPGVDLSAIPPRRTAIDRGAGLDFAGVSFDAQKSFRSLFDRNVREEFLGGSLAALEGNLAASPLVLACYASPTVCDAIKHYRVAAQTMLGTELDGARAIEQALDDAPRRARARAIKECLDEMSRQGKPLDEAMRACRDASVLRGLDGRVVREIDVLRDLGIPEGLVSPVTIGPGTLRGESRPTAVVEAYESRRRESLEAWGAAIREPSGAAIERLGPVTRAEVERIALMEPGRQQAVIRSLAAATALGRIVKEAHEVERALESGELAATPEVRAELERRRAQLRSEVGRLSETFEAERRLNGVLADARAAAEADVAERARERLMPRRAGEAARAAAEPLKPWGCEANPERRSR